MLFNGALICAVADVSAEAWQRILRRRERLSSQQLLGILCCVPLERVGRSACYFWDILCLLQPDYYYTYSPSSSSSSESDLLLDGHREGSSSEPDLPLDGDSRVLPSPRPGTPLTVIMISTMPPPSD